MRGVKVFEQKQGNILAHLREQRKTHHAVKPLFLGTSTLEIVSDGFRQFTMNVRYCTFDGGIGRFDNNSDV